MLTHESLIKVHFDDLTSFRQVSSMWDRYLGGTVAGLLWAAERGDVSAARHIVGVGLHAAQDFYSHSNWVDDPNRRHQTWFQHRPAAGEPHLYTGTYELPDHLGFKPHGKPALDCALLRKFVGSTMMDLMCQAISPFSNTALCRRWRECSTGTAPARPVTVAGVRVPDEVWMVEPGIALDSTWQAEIGVQQRDVHPDTSGAELFEAARRLAENHSYQWLSSLQRLMDGLGYWDYWRRVMTEERTGRKTYPGPPEISAWLSGYTPDLDQYEDSSRMLHTFLSAGHYPPRPNDREEGWFLRIEVSTAGDPGAGTDADIYAEGLGGHPVLLDHMHERRPGGGGLGENRLFEFNDFEAGGHAAYVLGPLPAIPTELTLHNSAADVLELLAAAWKDLTTLVGDIIDDLGDFLLSLIAGHADFVAGDKRTWSWAELVEIAAAGSISDFDLRCDGGDEGNYRIVGRLNAIPNGGDLRVTVRFEDLHCIKESKFDRGSSSDESFVLLLVNSPANGQTEFDIAGPYGDVDTGERRHMGKEWSVDVPRYGGLIVPVAVFESDDEGSGRRRELLDEFVRGYNERTVNKRSKFLDALGRAVAPDWRPQSISVYAFRRAPVVDTVWLAESAPIDRWIRAGERHTVNLTPSRARSTAVPRTAPCVLPFSRPLGDVNGDGKDDLVVWHPQTGSWQVALSDGAGGFPDRRVWLEGWAVGTDWVPVRK
ncbi:MAG: hypothetical protein M3313_17430 [Actinomycetota bacterium]|nr:hypothetical protein [Actinomycetota bacterium]